MSLLARIRFRLTGKPLDYCRGEESWHAHDWQSYAVTYIHDPFLNPPGIGHLANDRCRRCGDLRNPLIAADQRHAMLYRHGIEHIGE